MLDHCFVPIFHPVDGVPKAIIHSAKYHSKCMDSLIWAKRRWWMFDATLRRNDVAWSHNSMIAPTVHFVVISTNVSCKRAKVRSMGANEPSNTLTLSKQLSSSMVVNPLMSTMPTSSIEFWLQSSSSYAPSSNYKYVKSTNIHFKPP